MPADVLVCIIDPNLLVDPAALPDGSDEILNDTVAAYRSIQHLAGGRWNLAIGPRSTPWTVGRG